MATSLHEHNQTQAWMRVRRSGSVKSGQYRYINSAGRGAAQTYLTNLRNCRGQGLVPTACCQLRAHVPVGTLAMWSSGPAGPRPASS